MGKQQRFTKAAMIGFLENRVRMMEGLNGFDPLNGWAQVDGRSVQTIVQYGEYVAMLDLIDAINGGRVTDGASTA